MALSEDLQIFIVIVTGYSMDSWISILDRGKIFFSLPHSAQTGFIRPTQTLIQ
jgi:hypothetical protein